MGYSLLALLIGSAEDRTREAFLLYKPPFFYLLSYLSTEKREKIVEANFITNKYFARL